MGIKQFTELVRRFAPETIQQLPGGLETFRGKTLALDGNLLTQRFHHSPTQLPNRHLSLWYRFLRVLRREYDVKPICVFDGIYRLPQKRRELDRRKAAMSLLADRKDAEDLRGLRLGRMEQALAQLREMPLDARSIVLTDVRARLGAQRTGVDLPGPEVAADPEAPTLLLPPEKIAVHAATGDLRLSAALSEELYDLVVSATDASTTSLFSRIQREMVQPEMAIIEALLNIDATIQTVPPPAQVVPATTEKITISPSNILATTQLVALRSQSEVISASYGRRATPLTQDAYKDCEKLISAMGVPIIRTSAEKPHEAEALASTLVLEGLADTVATEDTDVLLYGASMVRNITGLRREVEKLDGPAIRQQMGLDRDQFIDLALLCGTDFTERIPRVGPVNALKLVKEHGSIEAILNHLSTVPHKRFPTLKDATSYLSDIREAREIFLNPPAIPEFVNLEQRSEANRLEDTMQELGIPKELTRRWENEAESGIWKDGENWESSPSSWASHAYAA